jgi:hypothetical protein
VTGGRRLEGRGEWEPNQILLYEPAYVPSSNPKAKTLEECDEHSKQERINDPLEVMNVIEKELDQLDIWLAKYDQNSEWTSD